VNRTTASLLGKLNNLAIAHLSFVQTAFNKLLFQPSLKVDERTHS